ncbi:hypothetical protein [Sphingomonas sp. C3-2]|uniref:hypothetical protein n=1 Tax=Sphingomonas sp. C3-2 TaxID=3062169 RepID=UPI00294AE30F|nr:hypothetical protein [Sphingomonas sp. C3-2]WOK35418.1 hypothetical protein QYC26_10315 [Sphingomonas sp. C3-2]
MRRNAVIFASLLLVSAPAVARDAPEADLARKIGDPRVQEHVADVISGAMGAVLDMRIGKLEKAIDPRSEASDDDTVRDRVADGDPDVESRMADRSRAMTGVMAGASARLADMLPGLRAAMGDILGQIGDIGGRMGDLTGDY